MKRPMKVKGAKKPLQINLDPELHAKFKSYCALRAKTMGEVLIHLIQDIVKGGAK